MTIFRRNDLKSLGVELKTEHGLRIKLHKQEVIEGSESANIQLSAIIGKCMVIKGHENESLNEVLPSNENNSMAYICRYKLVKETIYKLVPVSWQPGEEEMRHSGDMTDDEDVFTDAEDLNKTLNLSDEIDEIESSLRESMNSICIDEKTVSPIKIVNQQIVLRSQNKKRSSPDANKPNKDVSPSKRNKTNTNGSQFGSIDSPGSRSTRYQSPAQSKMTRIKKNLNDSFREAHSDVEDSPASPYRSEMLANGTIKLTKSSKVLQERNENSPMMHVKEPINHLRTKDLRRSILKGPDSAKMSKLFD